MSAVTFKHDAGKVVRARGEEWETIPLAKLLYEAQILARRGRVAMDNGAPATASKYRRMIDEATQAFNDARQWRAE